MKKKVLCMVLGVMMLSLSACGMPKNEDVKAVTEAVQEEAENAVEIVEEVEEAVEDTVGNTEVSLEDAAQTATDALGLTEEDIDAAKALLEEYTGEDTQQLEEILAELPDELPEDVTIPEELKDVDVDQLSEYIAEAAENSDSDRLVLDEESLNVALKNAMGILATLGISSFQDLPTAENVAAYLGQGHAWIACKGNQAVIVLYDGKAVQLVTMSKEADRIISEKVTPDTWSMTLGGLSLYDVTSQVNPEELTWSIQDDGGVKTLTGETEDGAVVNAYETTETTIEDATALVEAYLNNQTNVEDVEDFSTLLEGYEGVSIVDACFFAGIDPSYQNRALMAESIGIEGYKGTAEQNLSMIEMMGGVVKG